MMREPLPPLVLLLGPLLGWLASAEDCDISRSKCAYRMGCGQALHSYMVGCADVLAGRTSRCTWACRKALISLTSTDLGQALSTCDCGSNEFCQQSKERAEICRPEVSYATADDTVVSCSVAEWICAADPLCSTALDYYHRFCKSLFHGKKCTPRCNNSLTILDRQEKAAKLRNCYCDGSEDYPCAQIRTNTQRLCFRKEDVAEESLATSTAAPSSSASLCSQESALLGIVLFLCFRTIVVNLRARTMTQTVSVCIAYLRTVHHRIDIFLKFWWGKSISRCAEKPWPWWWTSE